MELTFALPNGTRAGVKPSRDARDLAVEKRCIEQSAATKDVAVIFHVPTTQALDRVMERYGPAGC